MKLLVLLLDDEFIKVECYNRKDLVVYRNLHAQIVPAKEVRERTLADSEEMNVLLLGCDSVSRLSLMRHAPELHRLVSHSGFSEIPVELANLSNLPNISAKPKKNCGCQMVTHPNLFPGLGFLNFSNLPIHSHFLNFWLMLVLCTIEVFNIGILLSLCEKKLKFTAHPSLKWLTFAQHKYEPKVKSVRVNGQITEVKETKTREQIRMGDHLASTVFFSLWQKY